MQRAAPVVVSPTEACCVVAGERASVRRDATCRRERDFAGDLGIAQLGFLAGADLRLTAALGEKKIETDSPHRCFVYTNENQ